MHASWPRSLILLAGLSLAVAACGASGSSKGASAGLPTIARHSPVGAAAVPSPAEAAPTGGASGSSVASGSAAAAQTIGATVAPAAADIVENGSLAVRFRSPAALESAYNAIAGLAIDAGGFVASSTLDEGRVPTASVTVRVPNDGVGGVLREIGRMGKVTHQTLSGQDVTGQVVDLSVEITNLTSEEVAVRQLLARTGSVAAILTVQQQLFSLQDEIQQLTAQSDSLRNQVQYATVAVTLSTKAPAPAPVRHHHSQSTAARFWHLASSHSVGLVRSVVLAVGWSAPGLVLLAAAGAVVLVVRRRQTRRGQRQPASSET